MKSNDLIIQILSSMYKKDSFKLTMKEIYKFGSKKEVDIVIQFLSESALIRSNSEGEQGYFLAPSGIAYLDKQINDKSQHQFNKMVAFTGAIIALIGIYTFIKDNLSFEDYPQNLIIIKTTFLFLLFLCIAPLAGFIINYWRSEVFRR